MNVKKGFIKLLNRGGRKIDKESSDLGKFYHLLIEVSKLNFMMFSRFYK